MEMISSPISGISCQTAAGPTVAVYSSGQRGPVAGGSNLKDDRSHTLTSMQSFARNLLTTRQNRLHIAKIDRQLPSARPMIPLTISPICSRYSSVKITLSFLHLLDDDLLGSLCTDSSDLILAQLLPGKRGINTAVFPIQLDGDISFLAILPFCCGLQS